MNHETVDQPTEAGLIFDCDGTLADTMPLHYLSWNKVLNERGIEFSEHRFYAMAGQPTVLILETLLEEQSVDGDANAMSVEKDQRFLELLPQVEPIEPVVEIARRFRDQCRMGVGSGSTRESVLEVLKHIGLEGFFDGVVCAEDTVKPKPAPDVFLEVARQIGVQPADCRVYEDADLGLEAASRAGMTAFDIRTIHTPRRIT
jgi:HAD superfamily hydrolase (TIGR01509 family)